MFIIGHKWFLLHAEEYSHSCRGLVARDSVNRNMYSLTLFLFIRDVIYWKIWLRFYLSLKKYISCELRNEKSLFAKFVVKGMSRNQVPEHEEPSEAIKTLKERRVPEQHS